MSLDELPLRTWSGILASPSLINLFGNLCDNVDLVEYDISGRLGFLERLQIWLRHVHNDEPDRDPLAPFFTEPGEKSSQLSHVRSFPPATYPDRLFFISLITMRQTIISSIISSTPMHIGFNSRAFFCFRI